MGGRVTIDPLHEAVIECGVLESVKAAIEKMLDEATTRLHVALRARPVVRAAVRGGGGRKKNA